MTVGQSALPSTSSDTFIEGGSPWVKDRMTDGDDGSCADPVYYKHSSSVYGEPSDDHNHMGDYYMCGDKDDVGEAINGTCKIVSFDEWKTTVGNCKEDSTEYSQDKCYNMVHQTTPGVSVFNMGSRSDSDNMFDPQLNTGGSCRGRSNIEATTIDCTASWTGSRDGSSDKEDSEAIGIASLTLNGDQVRPAYPNRKGILKKLGNRKGSSEWGSADGYESGSEPLDDANTTSHSDLLECPSTHTHSFHCLGDGFDTPGCGMGDDADPENMIRFCKRPTSHYKDENIINCCLASDGDSYRVSEDGRSGNSFKNCPVGYCVTEVAYGESATNVCESPIDSFKGGVGYPACKMMSKKCNDFFKDKCTNEVFQNTTHDLNGYCNTWADVMPSSFASKAASICGLPTPDDGSDEIDLTEDTAEINAIRQSYQNKLCRDWLQNNWQDNISKLQNICKHAVRDLGENTDGSERGWEVTPLGEQLIDICPCHYPVEYYRWWKEDAFNRGETGSSLTENIKPECFLPECQRTLLYPSGINPDCPSLQICRQSIENNIINIGESRLEPGETAVNQRLPQTVDVQACSIQHTRSDYEPPEELEEELSESSPGEIGTPSSERRSRSRRRENRDLPRWDEEEEEGDNTMLIIGIVTFIIIMIVIVVLVVKNNKK